MRNMVALTGYVAGAPKVFENKDGSKKVFLTVGVGSGKKDKDDKEITNFISTEALIKAGVTNDPITKLQVGDLVEIDAELRTSSYEKDGETMHSQSVFITKCNTLRKKA
ncbi:single-stranded DNA-binding protein [Filifactor alocis]|uniref:single-stranded DNA-binding protein n=1 Tax=Filifactor alocis TaxID=143361 RepID=UPI003FA0B3EA